ncbi:AMP-binding protein [Castellaniella sp. WN]
MSSLQTLEALLAEQVARQPEAIALIEEHRKVTYEEFSRLCAGTVSWLAARGIGRGDRVAVWLVNRLEWLALFFALGRLGATLVAVNTRYRAHELEHILEKSRARLLVLELNFRKIDFPGILADVNPDAVRALERVAVLNPAQRALPDTILGRPTVAFSLDGLPPGKTEGSGRADDLSILFTTSGTTSGPKLVMHTQYTISTHSRRVAQAYQFLQDEVCLLAALPLCGVFGFNAVLGAFAAGRPVVLMDVFDGGKAARLIGLHRVTHIFGSDEMFRRITEHGVGDRPFPSLRVCGFAAFHPGVETFGRAAWQRGIPMYGLYGSSEVQALFSLNRPDGDVQDRLRGGGLPASRSAQVRVRDVDTGRLLPAGRSGVIEIRSDTNFIGYLDNPDATAKAVTPDGYFITGDVGYLRDDGGFVYQTRRGDTMRLAGYLVDPVEIENALKELPGIANAQVVELQQAGGRTACAAFVILAPGAGLDEDEVKAALGSTLAAFKVPAHVWPIAEYPTTQSPNGAKIQRTKLRDMAMQKMKEAS